VALRVREPVQPDLIRRRLPLVNRTFQYARAARETFFAILSRKGEVGPVLRLMHNLGFLGRYLPEFGALDCLVQHEFYHRYTADEHTLVCIDKLDATLFADSEKLRGYRQIFQKIEALHEACPNNSGDWYFSGDYPTPGGNKIVNKAFMNYMEKSENRAYA
jgi:[protein-PII] uridylyltransferase